MDVRDVFYFIETYFLDIILFLRFRNEDEISSDDETPALKRLKKLRKTSFPDIMESKGNIYTTVSKSSQQTIITASNTWFTDIWEENKHSKNVRYVPIQLETGHPSTSTPNEGMSKSGNRVKTVPIKLVDVTPNGPSTPSRKPRLHTPVRPVIQAIIDDEDDDDQEVFIINLVQNNTVLLNLYFIFPKTSFLHSSRNEYIYYI